MPIRRGPLEVHPYGSMAKKKQEAKKQASKKKPVLKLDMNQITACIPEQTAKD